MTLDHCKALDYLLADQGGICAPATISCCLYVNPSGQIEDSTPQLPEKTTGRQRQISYITYTWNLKKQYKWTYLPKRNRVTDVENELMVTRGAGRRGQIVEEQSWRSSFYPLQCSQAHILLLLFNRVLECLLRKPGLLQMLFYLWAFVQVRALQVISNHSGKKQKLVYKLLPVPLPVLRSVYHQMHKCHGIQCWIPQLSQRHFHSWVNAKF